VTWHGLELGSTVKVIENDHECHGKFGQVEEIDAVLGICRVKFLDHPSMWSFYPEGVERISPERTDGLD